MHFVNINVAEFDAYKHAALPIIADARVVLEELSAVLGEYNTDDAHRARAEQFNRDWDGEVARSYNLEHGPPISQGEVIGAVNEASAEKDVVLCAAGSLPVDLHKLWRTRDPKGYHLEYGYSCMGYEIAGGLGTKMADPAREVYVMVGDGSYEETPAEVEKFLNMSDPELIGLVFDTGHYALGGGDAVEGLRKHWERIWHVHFKDFNPDVVARADQNNWGYQQLIGQGVFPELGNGVVDFPSVAAVLRELDYDGWIVVEQDVLPGLGTPKESAARNREYLQSIEM